MIWLIVLVLFIAILYYKLCIQPLNFWKERGIPCKKPYPIVGNLARVVFRQTSFFDAMKDIYEHFPNDRYNGVFQFGEPSLVIRDIDLIKRIGVKDFDYFTDHRAFGSPDSDPLFSKNLLQLKGKKWRDMRATLSPAFTSSKMKAMFTLISECAEQLTQYYSNKKESIIELEMKDLYTRYTNDVIATCAFGVKCDSIKDRENEFFSMGKNAMSFGGFRAIKILIAQFSPEIAKFFKISVFPKRISKYFQSLINETVDYRTANNIVRPDMIHLLLEARKGKLVHEEHEHEEINESFAVVEESTLGKKEIGTTFISNEEIAAQAFIFFLAGFETASTMLSFLSHEVAVNTDVQDKLYKEISEVMEKCNGKPTYEAVMKMKYLDMVVSETLRKWPPGPAADRLCTKDYVIKAEKPSEQDYTIKAGDTLFIPILGVHRDEKYFPNPDKFIPERFSDENRDNIDPFTYMPFGIGPRACIASRFALMEMKILATHLLNRFELVVIQKTIVPLKLSKKSLRIEPDNGFWLGLKLRKSK